MSEAVWRRSCGWLRQLYFVVLLPDGTVIANAGFTQGDRSERFGVSRRQVSDILSGRAWYPIWAELTLR
jgi:hypothetical protein